MQFGSGVLRAGGRLAPARRMPRCHGQKLLRATLIQVLYSVRSERQLMEQTQYNLLFRWFIGLAMDDAVWVPTVFSKNRERLIEHDAVIEFFNQIVQSCCAPRSSRCSTACARSASSWSRPSTTFCFAGSNESTPTTRSSSVFGSAKQKAS